MEFPRMELVNNEYSIMSLITVGSKCMKRNPCGQIHYLSSFDPIRDLKKNMKLPYHKPDLSICKDFCCADIQKKVFLISCARKKDIVKINKIENVKVYSTSSTHIHAIIID